MKLKKLFLLLPLLVLPFMFSSCVTSERMGTKHTLVLGGLYESKQGSYAPVPKNTFALRRAELDPAAPYSGNNVSFLWGMFTYYDY
jgi:hypothetical protein